ncbi:MAG TPA: DUF72 domain-containing protein [Sphingomonas sp.]|nr:DUF72 domain-containing protein [Sphingomonas sp.]
MIRVGIGGWTYEPWRGVFYPPKLPHAKEIEHATKALTAIEVNGTYYRRQDPKTFENWAKAAPEGFVYTLKASRFCTNRRDLSEGAEGIRNFFDQGLTELGDKLGPILWQLMGTKQYNADEIAGFLELLPKSWNGVPLRHAIEPRHESFCDPVFFEQARKAGVAVVYAHAEDYPTFEEQTAGFTYARLQQCREEIDTGYTAQELDRWADQAKRWAEGGRDVLVFFIAGAKVRAPAAAMALIERVGRP